MRAALRADDAKTRSNFLELYLHECLVRGGHEVVIRLERRHTSYRPDLLASRDTWRVFVEHYCTRLVTCRSRRRGSHEGNTRGARPVGDDNFFLIETSIMQGAPTLAREEGPAARQTCDPQVSVLLYTD